MKKTALFLIALAVWTPLFAFAAAEGIKAYLADLKEIINLLLKLVGGLALLVFFWGLARYIGKAGDPKAKESGRNLMVWGTIALFVMASIGGILFYIGQDLGISTNTAIPLPTFDGGSGGGGGGGCVDPDTGDPISCP